ncbi:MAG: putative lipid II flippase FtsW [Treponema sp.]|nr:putative lipid II flippase FtsW [Treponema sp.]
MSEFTFKTDRTVGSYVKSDLLFIICILILWGLGLFMLYICTPYTGERLFSNKYYFVTRQLVWSFIGFAGLVFFALIPMQSLRKMLPLIVLGTLILCVVAMLPGIGSERKGAARWIRLGNFGTIQPSEFAKFAVVLFLSNLFSKHIDDEPKGKQNFQYPFVGLLIFVVVIFLQKDFSTGLFVFFVGSVMFFVAGVLMSWFIPLMLLAIPAIVLMIAIEPYRLMRVIAFFHPEEYTLSSGYQKFASQRAISSGGIWGNGFGSGLTEVFKIPEVQTDYIFAGWVDAMGLFGVTVFFFLLIFFAWRGYRIAFCAKDSFASYAAFGCVTNLVVQSLLNCAVVCGSVPTTGVTLPFFSSGGSSLIVTLCMCGFIINASRPEKDEESWF